MLTKLEVIYRKLRRAFSLNQWLKSTLRLSNYDSEFESGNHSEIGFEHHGLILVQIDGLGFKELEKAIENGEAPFLQRLLKCEHYRCYPMYSGLPSSTPAVQGELFYGVKGIVPAFGFKFAGESNASRMFDPDTAKRVQSVLEDGHKPLLQGGSAYCNIYTGGAKESHFCASSLGRDEILKNVHPARWIAAFFLSLPTVVRMLFFFVVEIGLAFFDFFRGQLHGRRFWPEFKFAFARVAISVLMRDIVTESASIDIARGVPVVQLNYLGYDEQSHRRGPDSKFAHWSIKGIDRSIEKLWNAAHRTDSRHYELWVYADHGQELTVPYFKISGYSIQDAVEAAYHQIQPQFATRSIPIHDGVQHQRARLLGGRYLQKFLSPVFDAFVNKDKRCDTANNLQVVAVGPVGHIYLPANDNCPTLQERMAKQLVADHHIPAAAVVTKDRKLKVYTKSGVFDPLVNTNELLGEHHPYKQMVLEDLHQLCAHKDAGEVVLLGWIHGASAVSFPDENGAHAGIGPRETQAFAILPEDVLINQSEFGCFRPLTLHKAANQYLDSVHSLRFNGENCTFRCTENDSLRIMSYNVHSCVGMDGISSLKRIARVIARYKPDVVALQELDVGKERSHFKNQVDELCELLNMQGYFSPAMTGGDELYGDAILSKYPMHLIKSATLPSYGNAKLEPRSAIWASIDFNGTYIQLINTHLGLNAEQRRFHVTQLMGEHWISHEDFSGPAIVCGDFNALPGSYVMNKLTTQFNDVQESTVVKKTFNTFSSRLPALRIDHILTTNSFEVLSVDIPSTTLTRIASDHLPLIATVKVKTS